MYKLSEYAFVAGLITTVLGLGVYLVYALSGVRFARLRAQTAAGPTTSHGGLGLSSGPRSAAIGRYASIMTWLAVGFLTAALAFRAIATGHGPFANMYEFSVAFAWGILAIFAWFDHRYHQPILGLVALPLALALMLYATTIPSTIEPLVPALQNNVLLTVHVAVAIIAYGSFTIAFGAAVLYLVQPESGRWGLPRPAVLDEIGYRAIVVGFPFLTLVLILGALWAEIAWGRYWGWDPKETAALFTWLLYGAYLHARVARGWRGRRAAWLLVAGFAATVFTYFGNLFFGGLHSYSGLG
jgi:cytochrome c-type biogenesis protein CcsB